jgi:hydrogenase 3 maturation protease
MLNSLTAETVQALKPSKRLKLIITVGNDMRSDDGVGPYIASKIKATTSLKIINAAYNPENIIDEVCDLNPDSITFIDAADFRGKPGEVELIDKEHIPESSLSTHMVPLKVVAQLIFSDTGAEILYLGIQPKSVEFGENLSEEVKNTADEIVSVIKKEFSHA